MLISAALIALTVATVLSNAQVIPTGPNGPTNPPSARLDGVYNQTSVSRLVSLNSISDFCLWGPAEASPENTIGNTEPYVVAWCTQPRNGARLIPDGAIQSAHFVKTPNYVQIGGMLDGTKLNIPYGDDGGELDPHGAEGVGNPIGGNVTSNVVTGTDTFYEEWMSFMSYDQFCLRICTSENSTYPAAIMCQHEIDVLGCRWVMPGNYENNTFTTCDADAAYPPGYYPIPEQSTTSVFAQRYTNLVPGNVWTVGVTVTPASAYSMPASSNCVSTSTISNGISITGLAGSAAVATGTTSETAALVTSTSNAGAVRSSSSSGRSTGIAAATSAPSASAAVASSIAAAAAAASAAAASVSARSAAAGNLVNSGALWFGAMGTVVAVMVGGVVAL